VIFRPLEIIRGCSGANDQSRFLYDLNAFAEREAGTLLDTMFYYWQALCGDGQEMPHLRDFEPRQLFGDKIPDHLSAIVTEVANPANFIMIAHLKYTLGLFGGQLEAKPIKDFPSLIHAQALMYEYQRCRQLRRSF
jgi:hypothetical protein